MSEYWKSTPKYWCKHCKTFVRDTKLERANHDATPKHQGNLKRFLRDLHRGHEKDEKDKERAKAEVARLNGITTSGAAASSSSSGFGRGPTPSLPKPQATPSQRKQQLAQLAEMGVAVPGEFRPDMAMAGEWQVTSERIVEPDGGKKLEALALGVRKRIPDEEEAEESEAKKRRWGSTYRSHPAEADDAELDALLSNATRKGKAPTAKIEMKIEVKEEDSSEIVKTELRINDHDTPSDLPPGEEQKLNFKREPSDGPAVVLAAELALESALTQDGEEEKSGGAAIVFKKRKVKNIRQK